VNLVFLSPIFRFANVKPVILDYLASKTICSNDLVVVSPDVGGVARARAFAKKLSDAPLAIVDKRRHGHNVAEVIIYMFTYTCAGTIEQSLIIHEKMNCIKQDSHGILKKYKHFSHSFFFFQTSNSYTNLELM